MGRGDYRTVITLFVASGRIMVQWLKQIQRNNMIHDELHAKWFYRSWEELLATDEWCCTWPGPCIVQRFHDVRPRGVAVQR